MKITIATLANKRPDFVEMQYRSITQHVRDAEVEYVVFNNAFNDRRRFRAIEAVCRKLGVRSVPVPGKDLGNVCETVAFSMNRIWEQELRKVSGILVIIDSDMFFVRDVRMETLMHGHDIAFVPSYRGQKFEVCYPWTGLMFFNLDTLPDAAMLKWDTGTVSGHTVDVGGLNHYYLEKHGASLRILYLEMWNLEDTGHLPSGAKTMAFCINGNARYAAELDSDNAIVKIETADPHVSDMRSFPYQQDEPRYHANLVADFSAFEERALRFGFPQPFSIDLFKTAGADLAEAFVFHYKSRSNWVSFYTQEYNRQKTEALLRLLNIEGATLYFQGPEFYAPTQSFRAVLAKYLAKARRKMPKALRSKS